MTNSFTVSVIIPVYNAEKFLRAAVESAVTLEPVREILLIEDASPDNALAVCRQLCAEYPKVKLLQHPNGENRGPGASRNLGIVNAKSEFISFLDADDYYLPNRFEKAAEILGTQSDVDGVYDAVGTAYYDGTKLVITNAEGDLTTIKSRPSGMALFEMLLDPGGGHFHTNGIVIRKDVVVTAGMFNTTLYLHQDTDLWVRICYYGNVVAGSTDKAVAVRGVHANNRISKKNFESKKKLYNSIFQNFKDKPLSRKAAFFIARNYILYHKKVFGAASLNMLSNFACALKTGFKYPQYFVKIIKG